MTAPGVALVGLGVLFAINVALRVADRRSCRFANDTAGGDE